jgi:hypothetical protein
MPERDLFSDFPPPETGPYGKYTPRESSGAEFQFCDPRVRNSQEKARLTGQLVAIVERLRRGRASNKELSHKYACKYTGRISDLRKSGYDVRCVKRDVASGLTWYALFENGVEITYASTPAEPSE